MWPHWLYSKIPNCFSFLLRIKASVKNSQVYLTFFNFWTATVTQNRNPRNSNYSKSWADANSLADIQIFRCTQQARRQKQCLFCVILSLVRQNLTVAWTIKWLLLIDTALQTDKGLTMRHGLLPGPVPSEARVPLQGTHLQTSGYWRSISPPWHTHTHTHTASILTLKNQRSHSFIQTTQINQHFCKCARVIEQANYQLYLFARIIQIKTKQETQKTLQKAHWETYHSSSKPIYYKVTAQQCNRTNPTQLTAGLVCQHPLLLHQTAS